MKVKQQTSGGGHTFTVLTEKSPRKKIATLTKLNEEKDARIEVLMERITLLTDALNAATNLIPKPEDARETFNSAMCAVRMHTAEHGG